jgi:hypothetical protein
MNYAFKMMAVVLALGVLVLQGCQTTSSQMSETFLYEKINKKSNFDICWRAKWEKKKDSLITNVRSGQFHPHLDEVLKRGIDCSKILKDDNHSIHPDTVCYRATKGNIRVEKQFIKNNKIDCVDNSQFRSTVNKISSDRSSLCHHATVLKYEYAIKEVKKIGLDCGVKDKKTMTASKQNQKNNIDITAATCALMPSMLSCRFLRKSGIELCESINGYKRGVETYDNYAGSLKEANRRGLNCGVISKNKIITASKPKTQTYTKPITSSAELDAERQKRIELERKLAEMKNKQKQDQQRINFDNQKPIINAFTKQIGSNAVISGRVTDNIEVAEVLVNGQVQVLKSNGTFKTDLYVPRSGKTIEIVAYDTKGNKASKTMKIERSNIQQANVQKFKSLNPSLKTVKSNPNALALIIGISDYENTKASALYADSDAKTFYDYANMKLGIPSSNIKELINDGADRIDITRAIKTWLLKRTVTDKTDIYVFFAGHGLATDDGKGMYLLPYDGVPDLLEDSAIQRKELFADIQATKPRSVTVFLDTCYSGGTRNEETLVASLRPIIITAKQQSIPDNFTVLSAAKGNQTSQSLDEVKHGLFSYYMMLGMEGGADLNADKKITARELHEYLVDKVERQSQFRQTPELQGDKDRVLVQFN